MDAHRPAQGAPRQADRPVPAGDARQRQAIRRRAEVPAPEPGTARRARIPRADRSRGVRRPRREPRRVLDGVRDHRQVRLRVHGHVLRHAHGRGERHHAALHPRADRQVHPPAELGEDRDPVLLRPRDRQPLLVPDLVRGRAGQRRLQGPEEGVLDHVGRVRRLLRGADHQPGLQGLRRPVGVRGRRRGRARPAGPVGRARPARQPVGRPQRAGRDTRRPDRGARRRRRRVQRRVGGPVVPARVVVGVERHLDGRDRHRQAAHHPQAARERARDRQGDQEAGRQGEAGAGREAAGPGRRGRGQGADPEVRVAPARPRLVLPGLIPADPRLERYRVHPGAVTAVELDAGDEITVTDAEGRQRGELTVLARGGEDFAALGAAPDAAATVVRALASHPESVTISVTPGQEAALVTGPAGVAALAARVERGLDATTTRNLMGNAYPQPGLSGKFFDQDMRPLVEVVRDTVGRHDTFALACNARYYEDLGYPGHVNCTDNFNGQLGRFAVAARRGWPALNFFYNTFFNEANQLFFDEPWSRPGDYVLLRAMTDLVCASSACPDDIDPANAWNPTDAHVPVYPAERRFSMAIAHRVPPDAEPKLTRQTAFGPRWSALTRRTTEYRGYWLPTSFDNRGAIDEYWACREGAGVMDLSPLRKFEVGGPDAEG